MHIDEAQPGCDKQLLRRFLDQKLTVDEESELEAHLDQCPRCRRLITDSAAEQPWWAAAGCYLKRDDLDVIAGQGPIRSGSASRDQTDGATQVIVRQIREWLNPSDDPKYIGRFGGYEILGVVGYGGMGVVLKGFEPSLNRYVAIKVLSPALATSGAARQRFAREAQAAAAVLHENVIAIHRVDEAHGLPYLVMPFVSGVSLQRRIDDEGPLPLPAILRIGCQIASGLAAAHAQGLVHRDIKPANILLDRGVDRVTITDFGLARAADDGSLTRSGVIAGTPQFMSPEQSRGEAIDARSDLFSLGSVLYAMCTGHPPFRAETGYGILRRITDAEPRPVREINPEIPEWLASIVQQLHAKSPKDRVASAEELAELLEHCVAHVQQPTAVPLPSHDALRHATAGLAAERTPSSTRQTTMFRTGVFAMIITLAFGLLGLFLWQSADPPGNSGGWTGGNAVQVVVEGQHSGSDKKSTDGMPAIPIQRKEAPDAGAEDPPKLDADPDQKPLVLLGHEDRVTGVAFGPDGKLLVSSSWDTTVRVWDAATGREVHTLKHDPSAPRRTGHKGPVTDVAFSPDGKYLASAAASTIDKNVLVWYAEAGRIRYQHQRKHTFAAVAFSPDSKMLAAADYTSVRVWDNTRDSSTGGHREVLVLDANMPLSVAFSRDGKWLAAAGRDKKLRVWNAVTGEEKFTAEHTNIFFRVHFSPDGKRLLTTSTTGVNVYDATTGSLLFAMNEIRGAALSPDGKLLAGGQGNLVKLWDAATGQEVLSLKGHGNTIPAVAFSPDGTRVASGSRDRTVRIWTLPPRIIGLKGK